MIWHWKSVFGNKNIESEIWGYFPPQQDRCMCRSYCIHEEEGSRISNRTWIFRLFMRKQNSSFTQMPVTLTCLPCIIGNLLVTHLGCRACALEDDTAEQSKAPKRRAPYSFPKGTSEWGVTGHQPIVFNNYLYHKQYWAHLPQARKNCSFTLSNYFYQPVKVPIQWKTISGNWVLWLVRRKKIDY